MKRNERQLDRIIRKIDRSAHDADLKRRVAALVLAYKRAWSAEQIAEHFDWSPEDVAKWLEAGKFGKVCGGEQSKDLTQLN